MRCGGVLAPPDIVDGFVDTAKRVPTGGSLSLYAPSPYGTAIVSVPMPLHALLARSLCEGEMRFTGCSSFQLTGKLGTYRKHGFQISCFRPGPSLTSL